MNEGFPEASLAFLKGQDLLYKQFNTIDVYVEDTGKEQMYYNILSRLLPGVKLAKIFSLGGKTNVINEAKKNQRSKKKIYIVDLDFDDVLGIEEPIRNLIYLERYSIENYLVEKHAFYEQIREKKPSLTDKSIESLFIYEAELNNIENFLFDIALSSVVIKRYQLGIAYYKPCLHDFDTFYKLGMHNPPNVTNYYSEIDKALRQKDGRYRLTAKKRIEYLRECSKRGLDFIPGKWIMCLFQSSLRGKKLIVQKEMSSFMYSLSKDIDVSELNFLKARILSIMS